LTDIDPDKLISNIESSITLLYNKYSKLATDKDIFFVHDEIFNAIENLKETIALLENNAILVEDIIISNQR
jgi:hypothetical protein